MGPAAIVVVVLLILYDGHGGVMAELMGAEDLHGLTGPGPNLPLHAIHKVVQETLNTTFRAMLQYRQMLPDGVSPPPIQHRCQ
eukprot:gene9524-249_t